MQMSIKNVTVLSLLKICLSIDVFGKIRMICWLFVIKLLFIVVIDQNVNNVIDNQTVSMNQTIQQFE